jgi:ribosomal protein S18 acetylase RimI-like enzyme
MSIDPFCWQVETACLNAWPSPAQILLDGWQLRAAGGPTRRANSANMLHGGAAMDAALIERAEAFYRARGRPAMFRITEMAEALDPLLEARGYRIDSPTRTLCAELDAGEPDDASDILIEAAPSRRWLAARDRLSASTPETARAYRAIIATILLPCGFIATTHRGRIASLGFGVLQDDLLVIESMMTDPAMRKQGHARRTIAALLAWGAGKGARRAALQVAADNVPALGLYATLGFERDLYAYHYRVKD